MSANPIATQTPLTVIPKPDGQPRTGFLIEAHLLNEIKLDALRSQLLSAGKIAQDEVFVDQGVPVDQNREKTTDAYIVIDDSGDQRSIQVMSGSAAKHFWAIELWKSKLPAIDATSSAIPGHPSDGTESPVARSVSELSRSEQLAVLQNCGLFPRSLESATCAALRMGGTEIERAAINIVKCERIRIIEPQTTREDRILLSRSEEMQKWNSNLVDTTTLGMNVPLLFGFATASERRESADTIAQGQTVYLTRTLTVLKAEV